jgi:hypothetical protein
MSKGRITRVSLADDGTVLKRRSDGRREAVEGRTDWDRVAALTDEEVLRAAESDPDAQPLTLQQLRKPD